MTTAFTKLANGIWNELSADGDSCAKTKTGTLYVEIDSDELHTFIRFTHNGETSCMTMKGGVERFTAHLDAFLTFKCGFENEVTLVKGDEVKQYSSDDSEGPTFSAHQNFELLVNGVIAFTFEASTYRSGTEAKFKRFPFNCMWEATHSNPFINVAQLRSDEGDRRNPMSMIELTA